MGYRAKCSGREENCDQEGFECTKNISFSDYIVDSWHVIGCTLKGHRHQSLWLVHKPLKTILSKTPLWFYFYRAQRTLELHCLNRVKTNLSEAQHTFTSDVLTFYHGLTALLFYNLLVGLPANVYVVWLIVGGAGGAVALELFALKLSISEILFCILSLYVMLHLLLRMAMDIGILVLICSLQLMFMSQPRAASAWSATWLWCIPRSSSGKLNDGQDW